MIGDDGAGELPNESIKMLTGSLARALLTGCQGTEMADARCQFGTRDFEI